MIKVCKFGGSSLRDSCAFNKVKKIILADEDRQIVVVSAPGALRGEKKITDLLIELCFCVKNGGNYEDIIDKIYSRYKNIKDGLDLKFDLDSEIYALKNAVVSKNDSEYIISRGEYICAKMLAQFIGYNFVDAKDVICFDYCGIIDGEKTELNIKNLLKHTKNVVIPGFYGGYRNGKIKLFERGGSDVSGAIISKFVMADTYENFTDVDGVMTADPRVVNNPISIKEISYERIGVMAMLGASVLQQNTLLPVIQANIPVVVKNTFHPDCVGTLISNRQCDELPVVGICNNSEYFLINGIKHTLFGNITALYRLAEGIIGGDVEYVSLNHGELSVVVKSSKQPVVDCNTFYNYKVSPISLIGVVCGKHVFGVIPSAISALDGVNIKFLTISAGCNYFAIGVDRDDELKAVNLLYNNFFA